MEQSSCGGVPKESKCRWMMDRRSIPLSWHPIFVNAWAETLRRRFPSTTFTVVGNTVVSSNPIMSLPNDFDSEAMNSLYQKREYWEQRENWRCMP